jgi:nucleoside phosphorylase
LHQRNEIRGQIGIDLRLLAGHTVLEVSANFYQSKKGNIIAFEVGVLDMGVVYTFAASPMEARSAESLMARGQRSRHFKGRVEGTVGSNRVVSMVTGMGPANAARVAASELAFEETISSASSVAHLDAASSVRGLASIEASKQSHRSLVLVIGLAGSLSHSLKEGQVVVYRSVIGSDGCLPCSERFNNAIVSRLSDAGLSFTLVTGISGHKIAATRPEKIELTRTGADVVDMESYEILSASASAGIPAAVIRVISDGLDTEMPDFNKALKPNGEFAPLSLALACARRPLATVRLMKSSKNALKNLGLALNMILQSAL